MIAFCGHLSRRKRGMDELVRIRLLDLSSTSSGGLDLLNNVIWLIMVLVRYTLANASTITRRKHANRAPGHTRFSAWTTLCQTCRGVNCVFRLQNTTARLKSCTKMLAWLMLRHGRAITTFTAEAWRQNAVTNRSDGKRTRLDCRIEQSNHYFTLLRRAVAIGLDQDLCLRGICSRPVPISTSVLERSPSDRRLFIPYFHLTAAAPFLAFMRT